MNPRAAPALRNAFAMLTGLQDGAFSKESCDRYKTWGEVQESPLYQGT
jgi:hypothetical protein